MRNAVNLPMCLAIILPAIAGCAGPGSEKPITRDAVDIRALARSVWEHQTTAAEVPPASALDVPVRVAIVEFTVEYVEKADSGEVDLGTGAKISLPTLLQPRFIDLLPEFNRYPVEPEEVQQSEAYGRLQGISSRDPALLAMAESGEAVRFPAGGLLALDDGQADRDAILSDLLDELQADSALAVRLRVSIRDGRAAIEKGSEFRAVRRDGVTFLRSRLAIISAARVIAEVGESADGEKLLSIDSARFLKSLKDLFRPCMSMALIAAVRD